jgi:hypothetical protein
MRPPYVRRTPAGSFAVHYPELACADYIAEMRQAEYAVILTGHGRGIKIAVEGLTEGAVFQVSEDQRMSREFSTAALVLAHFSDCMPHLRQQMHDRPEATYLMINGTAYNAYDLQDRRGAVLQKLNELG